MRKRHVIFDFDGTIVNSAPVILECFRNALDYFGVKACVPINNELIGPKLVDALRRVTGWTDFDKLQSLANEFKKNYDHIAPACTPAYPGMISLLSNLRRIGVNIHIATNKRANPTYKIISHLKLDSYFTSIYAVDIRSTPFCSKEEMLKVLLHDMKVAASSAYYVGDLFEDGVAADANGLDFIAAEWGYGDWSKHKLPHSWLRVENPIKMEALFIGHKVI